MQKHFKPNPYVESYLSVFQWLNYELPGPGGKCIPMKYFVDLQKGGMPFYLLGMMIYFDNWSLGMWIYFVLHGSYGMLWLAKGQVFPDASFEQKVSLTNAVLSWVVVLGPYCFAGYQVASRQSLAAQNPHSERIVVACFMYIFGIVLMLGTDAQKYFVLQQKRGLITNGFNALSRNTNYLGEILIYASFNVIAQAEVTWYVYAVVWLWIFPSRMLAKEYSNSKKEGWEQYTQRSWFLLPKLFKSNCLSYIFYSTLYCVVNYVYSNGGFQSTAKMFV